MPPFPDALFAPLRPRSIVARVGDTVSLPPAPEGSDGQHWSASKRAALDLLERQPFTDRQWRALASIAGLLPFSEEFFGFLRLFADCYAAPEGDREQERSR